MRLVGFFFRFYSGARSTIASPAMDCQLWAPNLPPSIVAVV